MKKHIIIALAMVLFGLSAFCPIQLAALPAVGSDELGHYGSRFAGEYPIEPQINIYKMLRDEFKKTPDADTIRLEWEATPLHYAGYFRDEAMEALSFDYPEINLREYSIDEWSSELVDNYVSRITLVLKKNTLPAAGYDYRQRLAAANNAVSAGATSYQKAKAAAQWIKANCDYDADAAAGFMGDFSWIKGTSYAYEADGVFSYGKATSYGMAKAFKLLMDNAGVPCVLAHSLNRMWGYTQMDDGKWYVVDMDYIVRFHSGYFLKGNNYYTSMESTPPNSHMQYVGKGSMLTVSDSAYVAAEDQAAVAVSQPDHGTVSVRDLTSGADISAGGSVSAGTDLLMSCTPAAGYEVDYFSVNGSKYYPSNNAFTLDNIREAVTIAAVLIEIPPVPAEVDITIGETEGGGLIVDDGIFIIDSPGYNTYTYGQNLTITPNAEAGYEFSCLKIERIVRPYGDPVVAETLLAGPNGTLPLQNGAYTISHATDEYILTPYFKKADTSPFRLGNIQYLNGSAVVSVSNVSAETPEVAIVLAVYRDGSLEACFVQELSVAKESFLDAHFNWTPQAGSAYELKAFAWNGLSALEPLALPQNVQISE